MKRKQNKHPHSLEETVKRLENEMAKMYNDFKTNKEQTDNSLSELSTKVMSLRQLQPEGRQDNSSVLELIRNENSALKKENDFLRERIETLTLSLSALNNKIKSSAQEKESLVTVIRLLNEDLKMKSPVGAQQISKDHLLRNNEEIQTRKKTPSKCGIATAVVNSATANFNQYTVLPVHETSEDDDEVIEIDNGAESSQGKSTTSPNGDPQKQKHFNISSRTNGNVQAERNQSRRHRDEQSPKHKSQDHQDRPNNVAAIVGDSMLKFIDARKLRHSTNIKVAVKTNQERRS